MAKVAVRGIYLACDDEGQGAPPFVFIHGFACDRGFWRPQVEELSRDHRCVAIDLRGRGESDAVPPYDAATAADDVAAVMDALSVGPAIVVGHSLGGIVALLLNGRRPDLVLGTVLGDSPFTSAAGSGFPDAVRRLTEAGSMEPVRNLVESFFVEDTPHDIREHVRRVMLGCPAEVAAGMLDKSDTYAPGLDALARQADQKPLMAIWAERPLGDPEHLRAITMFVRQEPIPGTGHFFQLEKPAITGALLRAFLDDVERDPRLKTGSAGVPGW